jgi:hypothetical protein
MGKNTNLFLARKALRISKKKTRRKLVLKKRLLKTKKKYQNFKSNPSYLKRKFFGNKYPILRKKPEYGTIVKFLIPRYKKFSTINLPSNEDGKLIVPSKFSISENTEETMFFLKRLFHCLYTQNCKIIEIDYKFCEYLDVDASACMDLILNGFINYYNRCINRNHKVKIDKIIPVNFEKNKHIKDILFSIGAYRNLKNLVIENPSNDIIPFHLRIGDSKHDKDGIKKEIHETEIVDYVIDCLSSLGHELTSDAETNLSKVVGEVMANAEEHSNFRYRFAIGYFVKPNKINNELGIFKLSIFNFGDTIYETFSKPEKKELEIVKKMHELSGKYTRGGLFKKAKFEEETLWTLYSLQEGVTSIENWKRGKGTIRFLDRFFKLKGDGGVNDEISKLTLISGNTKIIFDGTYPLKEVPKENSKLPIQVMTFNDSGDISELPNEKFVTFVPQNFPGTLITAKICLTDKNIK